MPPSEIKSVRTVDAREENEQLVGCVRLWHDPQNAYKRHGDKHRRKSAAANIATAEAVDGGGDNEDNDELDAVLHVSIPVFDVVDDAKQMLLTVRHVTANGSAMPAVLKK